MKAVDWQRVWRGAGLQAVVLFVLAYVIRGGQPKIDASAASLVAFYDGDSTRILIATIIAGFAILNLTWFATAITAALRDAGKGAWGAAATAASAALAGVLFVLVTIDAALAYSLARIGDGAFASGLNDLSWVLVVLSSFPAAMLIMSGSFGLWRAGMISNRGFGLGVTAMVLVLARTTTWAGDGFWAPDGGYALYVAPSVIALWIIGISRVLLAGHPSTVSAVDRVAVPAQ
jgi:hypothetical protein